MWPWLVQEELLLWITVWFYCRRVMKQLVTRIFGNPVLLGCLWPNTCSSLSNQGCYQVCLCFYTKRWLTASKGGYRRWQLTQEYASQTKTPDILTEDSRYTERAAKSLDIKCWFFFFPKEETRIIFSLFQLSKQWQREKNGWDFTNFLQRFCKPSFNKHVIFPINLQLIALQQLFA